MDLDLSHQELIDLIDTYDEYIQEAVAHDRFASGWRPANITEFYNEVFLLDSISEEDESDEI